MECETPDEAYLVRQKQVVMCFSICINITWIYFCIARMLPAGYLFVFNDHQMSGISKYIFLKLELAFFLWREAVCNAIAGNIKMA